MMNLSVAALFVSVADHRGESRLARPSGFAGLLPARLRRALQRDREARELDLALARLGALSPHLLDDIGMAHGLLGETADAPVILPRADAAPLVLRVGREPAALPVRPALQAPQRGQRAAPVAGRGALSV